MFACVFLLGSSGCTTEGTNVNAEFTQEGTETRVYEVFGMDCPGCHGGLEKLVKNIPSIHDAKANWKEKQLMVTVKPGYTLDDEEIYDAIRRANFTVGKRIK
jgi:copper chaperone CopZ